MLSLTYVSSATDLLEPAALAGLLARVRPRNEERGLTGLLLYSGGNIIQVLEGPEEEVEATYAEIERDPRHRGLLVLMREPVEERAFPDWSMGFRDLGDLDPATLEGYNDFLQQPAAAGLAERGPAAYQLLKVFGESMR